MTGEKAHGTHGEEIVATLLGYEGWAVIDVHPVAHGHTLDLLVKRTDRPETLVEVKVWRDPHQVGTDNVKKAIADAWDLRAAGETRPYMLVLSHDDIGPLHREMLRRAIEGGAISEVRVLGFVIFS